MSLPYPYCPFSLGFTSAPGIISNPLSISLDNDHLLLKIPEEVQNLEGLRDGDNYHREKLHVSLKITSWGVRTFEGTACERPVKSERNKNGQSVGERGNAG